MAITPDAARAADQAKRIEVVSLYQKQAKIYPRSVAGRYASWRWVIVWITQLVFYGLPWIKWHGRQAVLFDLEVRRFYIWDLVLYPQDFIYLTALLVISAYLLFLFTAVAGRLWCGYACPQTVYTEIFLWIERQVEGDRIARMRLDSAPWSMEKVSKKALKHGLWIGLGLWTGFTFVGYFTPIQALWAEAFTLDFGPWEWFWVVFYGFATYGNAGWMREQVCKYMCPYARFQSAMFDKDTLIVSYDDQRGEPRGSRSRHADHRDKGLGDCIDCGLCVQVCPTGIDIRRGLQYECIGCAACVDVCNEVMDKMSYPRGLVRYATENSLAQRWPASHMWSRVLRPRVIMYSGVLLLIIVGVLASLWSRVPFRVDVVRDRVALARPAVDGGVENGYRLVVMNATEVPQAYHVQVQGLPGIRVVGRHVIEVGPAQSRALPVSVQIPAATVMTTPSGAHHIEFWIERRAQGDLPSVQVHEKSTFVLTR